MLNDYNSIWYIVNIIWMVSTSVIYITIFWSLSRASLEGQATETTAPFMYFGEAKESFNISKSIEIK